MRCTSAPVARLEYEVDGKWGSHGHGYSLNWPSEKTEVAQGHPITLESAVVILQFVPPGTPMSRPEGKRYLVFHEPRQSNHRLFERYRNLGYAAEGSGCDVYYLDRPVAETDPDLVPSEAGNYNY